MPYNSFPLRRNQLLSNHGTLLLVKSSVAATVPSLFWYCIYFWKKRLARDFNTSHSPNCYPIFQQTTFSFSGILASPSEIFRLTTSFQHSICLSLKKSQSSYYSFIHLCIFMLRLSLLHPFAAKELLCIERTTLEFGRSFIFQYSKTREIYK
jgi:hypothetical protein